MRGKVDPQSDRLGLVSPESRVPKDHPLRRVKPLLDRALADLSPLFQEMYAELGRPSIPPERLLQVHDELVFDLFVPEEAEVRALVADKMKTALDLPVPIDIEIGTGNNWLEAH